MVNARGAVRPAVARRAARRKAPSPSDHVTSDVIIHGGDATHLMLALLFNIALRGLSPLL